MKKVLFLLLLLPISAFTQRGKDRIDSLFIYAAASEMKTFEEILGFFQKNNLRIGLTSFKRTLPNQHTQFFFGLGGGATCYYALQTNEKGYIYYKKYGRRIYYTIKEQELNEKGEIESDYIETDSLYHQLFYLKMDSLITQNYLNEHNQLYQTNYTLHEFIHEQYIFKWSQYEGIDIAQSFVRKNKKYGTSPTAALSKLLKSPYLEMKMAGYMGFIEQQRLGISVPSQELSLMQDLDSANDEVLTDFSRPNGGGCGITRIAAKRMLPSSIFRRNDEGKIMDN
ncbi:MAG: hypothetical protein ACKVTZ_08135 [Bacteroidia bacterium]